MREIYFNKSTILCQWTEPTCKLHMNAISKNDSYLWIKKESMTEADNIFTKNTSLSKIMKTKTILHRWMIIWLNWRFCNHFKTPSDNACICSLQTYQMLNASEKLCSLVKFQSTRIGPLNPKFLFLASIQIILILCASTFAEFFVIINI